MKKNNLSAMEEPALTKLEQDLEHDNRKYRDVFSLIGRYTVGEKGLIGIDNDALSEECVDTIDLVFDNASTISDCAGYDADEFLHIFETIKEKFNGDEIYQARVVKLIEEIKIPILQLKMYSRTIYDLQVAFADIKRNFIQ